MRTGSLALALGAVVRLFDRRLSTFFVATLMALWITLGGHFVELLFRNRLRGLISPRPLNQAGARLVYWLVAGALLFAAASVTGHVLTGHRVVPWPWWTGSLLFLAVELLAHLLLQLRGQPSFYNGRG